MPLILHTRRAENDLIEIWSYIAADSVAAADEFLDRIGETCRMLGENPRVGRARKELGPRLRSFPVGKYVVFYRPTTDGITVIRVLHGARDLPNIF